MIEGLAGVVLGFACVMMVRRFGWERWWYALSLLFLPLVYAGFALLGKDIVVAWKELAWGLPFLLAGLLLPWFDFRIPTILTGTLWLAHGAYDLGHDLFLANPNVPVWYSAFCAGVDVLIGGYLLCHAAWGGAAASSNSKGARP